MITILAVLSVLAYVSAAMQVGLRARRLQNASADNAQNTGNLPAATVVALICHAALLYQTVWSAGVITLGLFSAASLVCWVAALALFVTALHRPLINLGVLVLPICALAVAISAIWSGGRPSADAGNVGFQTHVATSITAYAVLLLAACQAVILSFQEGRLAARRPGGLLRILPPLTTQETLLFQLLGAGFFLLSLGLASGLVFVENFLAQHLAHKAVLGFIAWGIFGVLLWGRWRRGWRGRMAVRLVLWGFGVLLIAYFGSKLVLEILLERPWFAT